MATLVDAGFAPKAFPMLAGVPRSAIRRYPSVEDAVLAFGRVAARSPEGANAALNAYLYGVTVPDCLSLSGRLWLTSLPPGLVVPGYLNVGDSGLISLPEGLVVREILYAFRCVRLATLPADLRGVRTLLASGSGITTLPVGLTVGGDLDLSKTPIRTLPAGLSLGGKLTLARCQEWDGRIPEGARIEGGISADPRKGVRDTDTSAYVPVSGWINPPLAAGTERANDLTELAPLRARAEHLAEAIRPDLAALRGRWRADGSPMDLEAYAEALRPSLGSSGATLVRMTRHPFGVRVAIGEAVYAITLKANGTYVVTRRA
jgi:hypothetical protein